MRAGTHGGAASASFVRSKIYLAVLTFTATQFVRPRQARFGELFAPESQSPPMQLI